jgi:MscS family membrane protein
MMLDWDETLFAGNELWRWGASFGTLILVWTAAKLGHPFLHRWADRLEARSRVFSAAALRSQSRSMSLLALAIAFPIALAFLQVPESFQTALGTMKAVGFTLAIGFSLYQLADVVPLFLRARAARSGNQMDLMLAPMVRTSLRVAVILLTLLQVLQSLTDKPLTAILAGLSVGGLALALAAQDAVKNFFGSIVLFADKPFLVGERIQVDAVDGAVEEIGFRSTRIRTLEGNLVTLPNGDLANKTIVNIQQRPHIRHQSVLNLTYDTPPERVRRAIEILRELLADHEGMRPEWPPRVIFQDFSKFGLGLLVMFWYHPGEYWDYLAFVERLNLRILEAFNREGIEFAFPSQTLYLAGDPKRPLPALPPAEVPARRVAAGAAPD